MHDGEQVRNVTSEALTKEKAIKPVQEDSSTDPFDIDTKANISTTNAHAMPPIPNLDDREAVMEAARQWIDSQKDVASCAA